MSTDWYFVRDGARVGPRPRDEVEALLSSGELPPATLVWTAGMEGWEPAAETTGFGPLLRGEVPAPPPRGEEASPAYLTDPRPAQGTAARGVGAYPWRRWMARLVDMFCFGMVLGTVIAFVSPDVVAQANPVALNVLVLALFVPVEALVLSALGSTPGKRLLRIRVTHEDGARLGFGTALERSVQVWVRGLALGLPFISLFTLVRGYLRLTGEGRTTWDEKLGLRVSYGEMSVPRWAGVVVLFLLVFAVIVAGNLPADV